MKQLNEKQLLHNLVFSIPECFIQEVYLNMPQLKGNVKNVLQVNRG